MTQGKQGWTDQRVEQIVGNLLRFGVCLAAAVVLLGGVLFLLRDGATPPEYATFEAQPGYLRSPEAIVKTVFSGYHPRALIQLGLLLLIATPVARVFFSIFAFSLQRDWMYVAFTVIVLAVLLYSLFSSHLS